MTLRITTEFKVQRRGWTSYDSRRGCGRGSGYCLDQGQYQLLIQVWKWHGITIWSRVLDREEVPTWAWIDAATLGFTDWRSKFHTYITSQRRPTQTETKQNETM